MKAADVMVSNVITVGPDASVQDVADILLTNRISAVPVVGSNGELVGIISEGDLIRRAETDTERHRSWWLELLIGRTPLAAFLSWESSWPKPASWRAAAGTPGHKTTAGSFRTRSAAP